MLYNNLKSERYACRTYILTCLSVSLSVFLSVCLPIYLSVCLSVKYLFCPNTEDIMLSKTQQTISSFDCTTFVWKSQLCIVMSCAYFGPKSFPFSNFHCLATDIAEVGTIFNDFNYDTINEWMRYVLFYIKIHTQIIINLQNTNMI